eukprot:TRINITY_DN2252_c0_g1_i2.p1 TRINITY_DN2252_c0_g1~~TRINITY_DN2252_c0_g1_i2.p1  ORF type:complete len:923 (+),score=217.52 TRINITY_DN2252_c0_g1_i2:60-2828(+)
MKGRKGASSFLLENVQTFRHNVLAAFSKLNDQATMKTGLDELREQIANNGSDPERINYVFSVISEHQDHQKATARREYIRVLGVIAEVLESRVVEVLPRILAIIARKLKDNDNIIHSALSDAIGEVVQAGLSGVRAHDAVGVIESTLNTFFGLLYSGAPRFTQIGAAMCITRVLQSSPLEPLHFLLGSIVTRLLDLIKSPAVKATAQLFESLLSLLLGVETKFVDFVPLTLPPVVEALNHFEWTTRKLAIDIIYTLAVLLPTSLHPHKSALSSVLANARSDKVKHVREAALVALNIVREFPEPQSLKSTLRNSVYMTRGEERQMPPVLQETNNARNRSNSRRGRTSGIQEYINTKKEKLNKKRDPSQENRRGFQDLAGSSGGRSVFDQPMNPSFVRNAIRNDNPIEIRAKSPPPMMAPAADVNTSRSESPQREDERHSGYRSQRDESLRQRSTERAPVMPFTARKTETQTSQDFVQGSGMKATDQDRDTLRFENFNTFHGSLPLQPPNAAPASASEPKKPQTPSFVAKGGPSGDGDLGLTVRILQQSVRNQGEMIEFLTSRHQETQAENRNLMEKVRELESIMLDLRREIVTMRKENAQRVVASPQTSNLQYLPPYMPYYPQMMMQGGGYSQQPGPMYQVSYNTMPQMPQEKPQPMITQQQMQPQRGLVEQPTMEARRAPEMKRETLEEKKEEIKQPQQFQTTQPAQTPFEMPKNVISPQRVPMVQPSRPKESSPALLPFYMSNDTQFYTEPRPTITSPSQRGEFGPGEQVRNSGVKVTDFPSSAPRVRSNVAWEDVYARLQSGQVNEGLTIIKRAHNSENILKFLSLAVGYLENLEKENVNYVLAELVGLMERREKLENVIHWLNKLIELPRVSVPRELLLRLRENLRVVNEDVASTLEFPDQIIVKRVMKAVDGLLGDVK